MAKDNKMLSKKILAITDSRYQFNKLVLGLREEFKPEGFYENLLVDKLITDYWRLRKALIYERDRIYQLDHVDGSSSNNEVPSLVNYIKNIEKSIKNGEKAITEVKKEHKFGFV